MILASSFSAEWLKQQQKESGRDPGLIEKMIYALHLVEQLQLTGLPFIFKGGTSLVLLMNAPLRFSVDIDIVVAKELTREQLEGYLDKIPDNSQFAKVALDERRSYKGEIPKAHYKFIYTSNAPSTDETGNPQATPEREILLDVLFADNPYPALVERPVISRWLEHDDQHVVVQLPCINSIAGDKMVAFAPCTTGVPYFLQKEREIIKQLFDVGNLYDEIADVQLVRTAYHTAATAEISYRAERGIKSVEEVLEDTIATALILAVYPTCKDGNAEKLKELQKGIQQFTHFVFDRKGYKMEDAQLSSAKAAYLAAYLLKGEQGPLQRFDKPSFDLKNYFITNQDYNLLNKRLKFVKGGEALFYWYHTINLLYPAETPAPSQVQPAMDVKA